MEEAAPTHSKENHSRIHGSLSKVTTAYIKGDGSIENTHGS
jgi:hypothetical protein